MYAWVRTCVRAWVCFRCYGELWCVFVAVLSGVVSAGGFMDYFS